VARAPTIMASTRAPSAEAVIKVGDWSSAQCGSAGWETDVVQLLQGMPQDQVDKLVDPLLLLGEQLTKTRHTFDDDVFYLFAETTAIFPLRIMPLNKEHILLLFLLQYLLQSCSRGGRGENGGHVQLDTTSRGLCCGTRAEPDTFTQGAAFFYNDSRLGTSSRSEPSSLCL
jgi:hypothetical protein